MGDFSLSISLLALLKRVSSPKLSKRKEKKQTYYIIIFFFISLFFEMSTITSVQCKWTSVVLTWWNRKLNVKTDVYCTILFRLHPPFILCTSLFHSSVWVYSRFLSLHVSLAFLVLFFFSVFPSLSSSFFPSFSGHADDTGLGQTKWFHSAEVCQGEIA